MRISVIIPLHNGAATVGRAIESALSQLLAPREVIVVDDGSSDSGPDIVAEHFPQVLMLRQPNMGAGEARNTGIRRAMSEWLAFLDADDVWSRYHLELAATAVHRYPDAAFIASAPPRPFRVNIAGLSRTEALMRLGLDSGRPKNVAFSTVNYVSQQPKNPHIVSSSTVLVRRNLFGSEGLRFGRVRNNEDLELWVKIGLRHSLVTPQAVTAIISRTPGSTTDVAARALAEDARPRDCFAYLWRPPVAVAARALASGDFGICDQQALERFVDHSICSRWKEVLFYAEQACARKVIPSLFSWRGPRTPIFVVVAMIPRPVARAVSSFLQAVHRRYGRRPVISPFVDINSPL